MITFNEALRNGNAVKTSFSRVNGIPGGGGGGGGNLYRKLIGVCRRKGYIYKT